MGGPIIRLLSKLSIHLLVLVLVVFAILLVLHPLQWTSRINLGRLAGRYRLQGLCPSSSNQQNKSSDARVILLRCTPEEKRKHDLRVRGDMQADPGTQLQSALQAPLPTGRLPSS